MRPEIRWPVIIVVALGVHAVAWLGVAWLATSNPTYAVEEDYYAKAMAFDQTRAQRARNAELGWNLSVAATPAPVAGAEATLTVALTDRSGAPVDGATVVVEAFHNVRADRILEARLRPFEPGRYAASLPMSRDGLWELRFTVSRGTEVFTDIVRQHLVVTPRPWAHGNAATTSDGAAR